MSLEKYTLGDLPKLPQIFSIAETKTVREALTLLVEKGIFSVPVVNGEGKYEGTISLDGIIAAIIKLFTAKTNESTKSPSQRIAHHKYSKTDIAEITTQFNNLLIKDANVISLTPLVDPSTKLTDAIKLILESRKRLVVGTGNTITNLMSPYQFIKFFATHKDLPAHSHKLKETKAKISSPVQSITNDYSAIATFAKMIEKGFSGLAIVEEEKIITAITLKDISLASKDFVHLLEPCEDYVKNVRQSVIETTTYPTINVADNDLVGVVCQKFIATKTHRVFVRHENQLYGILSVSDLLAAFL